MVTLHYKSALIPSWEPFSYDKNGKQQQQQQGKTVFVSPLMLEVIFILATSNFSALGSRSRVSNGIEIVYTVHTGINHVFRYISVCSKNTGVVSYRCEWYAGTRVHY